MGNTLCKERGDNRPRSPKSPVDRVLSRCAQVLTDIFFYLWHCFLFFALLFG